MTDQEKLFDMYQYGNYDALFRWGTDMIKENARLRKALNDAQGKTQQHATEIILEALGE